MQNPVYTMASLNAREIHGSHFIPHKPEVVLLIRKTSVPLYPKVNPTMTDPKKALAHWPNWTALASANLDQQARILVLSKQLDFMLAAESRLPDWEQKLTMIWFNFQHLRIISWHNACGVVLTSTLIATDSIVLRKFQWTDVAWRDWCSCKSNKPWIFKTSTRSALLLTPSSMRNIIFNCLNWASNLSMGWTIPTPWLPIPAQTTSTHYQRTWFGGTFSASLIRMAPLTLLNLLFTWIHAVLTAPPSSVTSKGLLWTWPPMQSTTSSSASLTQDIPSSHRQCWIIYA